MNDRLRFRAYYKPQGKMYDVYSFDKNFVQANPLGSCVTSIRHFQTENCILEQCTGLKDKNGKLIYEGDILRSGRFYHWLVEWDTLGFVVNDLQGIKRPVFFVNNRIEVVGNIHENPELLNV